MEGADLVPKVTTARSYDLNAEQPHGMLWFMILARRRNSSQSSAGRLSCHGCSGEYTRRTSVAMKPHGVVLSNGPGDPAAFDFDHSRSSKTDGTRSDSWNLS